MGLLRRTDPALLLVAILVALLAGCTDPYGSPPSPGHVPVAVLGDSDSHAYQDRVTFPEGGIERGGRERATALQWIEVLSRLRGHEIDPGDWGEWGMRSRWATPLGWLGFDHRSPHKQDYEFNYAWSGARCSDLVGGGGRQAPRLAGRIAAQPAAWRGGVVVIRIGINDLGTHEALDAFAREGDSEANRRRVDGCLADIDLAMGQLAEGQPGLNVLLVGVLDNVDWPRWSDRYTDAAERRRIAAMLDRFDDGLRAMAASSPNRAFFDDRAFYRGLVGARDAEGHPAYRAIPVRDANGVVAWSAAFAEGDGLAHLYLTDGHAGTVLNAHWAQALAAAIKDEFGAPLTPISDAERDAFLIGLSKAAP